MGFRFRRSLKIFPGVRWNLSTRGSSLSFGGRGAHYTVGSSGSRFTFGIPGTGMSWTDYHPARTGHPSAVKVSSIPPPDDDFLKRNTETVHIHFSDRRPDEPPITTEQLQAIEKMIPQEAGFDFSSLGRDQAEEFLGRYREEQRIFTKKILKKYLRENGARVPGWVIDHAVDFPGKPIPGTGSRWGAGRYLVAALILYAFVSSMVSLVRKNLGDEGTPGPSSVSTVPPPSSRMPTGTALRPSGMPLVTKAVEKPVPAPERRKAPYSGPLPEKRFWPTEVRINAAVQLRGTVDDMPRSRTARPGAVLNAKLSPDHRTVRLSQLGLSGELPIGETDFADRAVSARDGGE